MTEEDDDDEEDGPYYTPECDGMEQNEGMMTLRHEEQMKSSKKKVQERIFKVELNPLPATYQFPNMTRQQLVTNWLLGDKEMNVPPLWSLNATLVGHVGTYSKRDPKKNLKRPSGPSDWQCMQAVMSVIERYGREHGCWQSSHKNWNYKNVSALWEKIEPILDSKFGGNSSKLVEGKTSMMMKRKRETSWKTLYNYMSDANEFGNSRNKQQKTD
jgi:hypothetical protein